MAKSTSRMLNLALLVVLITHALSQQQQASVTPTAQSFSSVCQSGIREDNTNYIYCARRSLGHVPLFAKNNVIYDELVLSDNRIGALTAASFARIKVKKIFLNGNPVRRVDPLTFAKLENHLEELWLDAAAAPSEQPEDNLATSGDELETTTTTTGIPLAIVNYLRNLNTLRLRNLRVPVLDDHVFKRLNRIEILSLQFCAIEQIAAHAFDSGIRSSLRELYLDGNRLQTVPSEALLAAGQFRQLAVLSLSQNQIKQISADSFLFTAAAPTLLRRLDLSYNGLRQIDAHSLAPLNASLDTLLLQNNELGSHQLRFIQSLHALAELNLDFNLITRLPSRPSLFTGLVKLSALSMQGNSISFEEPSSSPHSDLAWWSPFYGLTSLQRLNLARNGLKSLGVGLFEATRQLKHLVLDKNPLKLGSLQPQHDTAVFSGIHHSLVNISLQHTQLQAVGPLRRFQKLERARLASNEIQGVLDLADFARSSHSLANLDLQGNQIVAVVVRASSESESESESSMVVFENLSELDLANNRLCTFDLIKQRPPSSSSSMTQLLPKLRHLGLAQNPLVCDCHLLPLYEWARLRLEREAFAYVQWQCELEHGGSLLPPPPRRVKFGSLSSNDFVCADLNNRSRCEYVQTMTTKTTTPTSAARTTNTQRWRLKSFELRAGSSNSLLASWSLVDEQATTAATVSSPPPQILGFRLSYNKKLANGSVKTFLIEKNERQFKIDNLEAESIFTICLSVLHVQATNGYDKYCKDMATPAAAASYELNDNDDDEAEIASKLSSTLQVVAAAASQHSTILAPVSASSNHVLLSSSSNNNNEKQQQNASAAQSTVLSTLMFSLLVILIFFVCALVAFLYVYAKKCRLTQRKLKQANAAAAAASTLTSRKNYLSGTAILYPGINGSLMTATIDPRKILIAAAAAANGNGNGNGNGNHHTLLNLKQPCDNSTVSSTLSNGSNSNNPANQLILESSATTTPTSFTQYIVQSSSNNIHNSDQQQQQHYIAYDYNLGALIIPTNSLYHPQYQQQQAFLNSNSAKQMFNMNSCSVNSNNGNDHVYCEIPSTLSRPTCRPLVESNAHFLLLNSNNNNNNNKCLNANSNHQQNSSSSLLLSTTSSSSNASSNSSSPQSSSVQSNNTKYTNASII